jgi:hypothetical protein
VAGVPACLRARHDNQLERRIPRLISTVRAITMIAQRSHNDYDLNQLHRYGLVCIGGPGDCPVCGQTVTLLDANFGFDGDAPFDYPQYRGVIAGWAKTSFALTSGLALINKG